MKKIIYFIIIQNYYYFKGKYFLLQIKKINKIIEKEKKNWK